MHYYSQRSATNKELAVVDFLLASNPQSKVYDEKAIMNMYKQSQGTSGGFLSMFGMKSTTPKTNSVHPPNDTGNKSNNSNTDSPPVKSRGISFADEDIQDSQTDSTKARPKTRRRMTAKPVQRRSIHG